MWQTWCSVTSSKGRLECISLHALHSCTLTTLNFCLFQVLSSSGLRTQFGVRVPPDYHSTHTLSCLAHPSVSDMVYSFSHLALVKSIFLHPLKQDSISLSKFDLVVLPPPFPEMDTLYQVVTDGGREKPLVLSHLLVHHALLPVSLAESWGWFLLPDTGLCFCCPHLQGFHSFGDLDSLIRGG